MFDPENTDRAPIRLALGNLRMDDIFKLDNDSSFWKILEFNGNPVHKGVRHTDLLRVTVLLVGRRGACPGGRSTLQNYTGSLDLSLTMNATVWRKPIAPLPPEVTAEQVDAAVVLLRGLADV